MKKFWALLLAALLVVSILPVSALAADVPEPTPAFEQGTLTINVAFNGLPEDKIPESVKWGLKKDGAHVQDVVITAAEKWTKSLTLDPGEYELHADVDSADVGGYYHFYYSIIWATVTAGEDTKLDITETYEVQPVMSFDIPVEKRLNFSANPHRLRIRISISHSRLPMTRAKPICSSCILMASLSPTASP